MEREILYLSEVSRVEGQGSYSQYVPLWPREIVRDKSSEVTTTQETAKSNSRNVSEGSHTSTKGLTHWFFNEE